MCFGFACSKFAKKKRDCSQSRIEKALQKQAIAVLIKIGFRSLFFFFFIKLQNVIIEFFSIHLEGFGGGGGAYNDQMYFLVYSHEMGL